MTEFASHFENLVGTQGSRTNFYPAVSGMPGYRPLVSPKESCSLDMKGKNGNNAGVRLVLTPEGFINATIPHVLSRNSLKVMAPNRPVFEYPSTLTKISPLIRMAYSLYSSIDYQPFLNLEFGRHHFPRKMINAVQLFVVNSQPWVGRQIRMEDVSLFKLALAGTASSWSTICLSLWFVSKGVLLLWLLSCA
jgi:hypothetical protein